MKLLLLSLNHYPERTGIGKFQGEMAAWFAARGHEVRVIAAPPYYPEWKIRSGYAAWRYKTEEIAGTRVYRVPIYVPATPCGLTRLLHLASFACTSFPVTLGQALAWCPDTILLTAPPLIAAPAVLLAGALSGAHTQLHVQDFEADAAFQLSLLKKGLISRASFAVERQLLRAFDGVSSISSRMCERLLTKGVARERISLAPNWANVEDFDPAKDGKHWRVRLETGEEDILALYAGNLGHKQGLEIIVEAARLLRDKRHIRFVISGDGAARRALQTAAADLQNITFLPVQPMEDFISLMLAADMHLLPQKTEAADLVMPSKLGNMLASGKPVVAGAEPGTQIFEAVQGCGLAVKPEDPSAFAAAILSLATDKELRAHMGAQGRRRAQDEWSRDSVLQKLETRLASARKGVACGT